MNNTKDLKYKKILSITGYVIIAALLVISIIFMVNITRMNILKNVYLVILWILLMLEVIIYALLQRWVVSGIVTKIISIAVMVILILGNRYINATRNTINKITDVTTKEDHINLYVLKEDSAMGFDDICKELIGILRVSDRDNVDRYLEDISKQTGTQITTSEYEDIQLLIDALIAGEVRAVIVNEAYFGILTGIDGYENIENELKIIDKKTIHTEIETDPEKESNPYDEYKDYLYGGEDVFTMYISGIDTNGLPTVNRNSDVNILMVVNTKTRQILTINTPRDFYVPLSISNGVKDKLTHAGCYGVDVSVDTLEMLYGINIDYYLKINFDGFVQIIDALDGIDVYSEYEFTVEPIKTYVVGNNHLNGIEALAFARERHSFATGDRQRGVNQMAVIKSVINKMASSDMLLNYTDVLAALGNCMITNMSYDTMVDLIKFQLSDMRGWNVVAYSVNGSGDNLPCFSLSSPNYVMIPDEATVEQAKQYLATIYSNNVVTIG